MRRAVSASWAAGRTSGLPSSRSVFQAVRDAGDRAMLCGWDIRILSLEANRCRPTGGGWIRYIDRSPPSTVIGDRIMRMVRRTTVIALVVWLGLAGRPLAGQKDKDPQSAVEPRSQ